MEFEDSNLVGCFISIPKCASKTVLEMFEMGKNRGNHWDEKTPQFIIYENHKILKRSEEKFNLQDKYVFTFVRHPYERIRSWFTYCKHVERIPMYQKHTLNSWVRDGCPTHWKNDDMNKVVWDDHHFTPLLQCNFIEGKSKVSYIGRIESFEKDSRAIMSDLNHIFESHGIQKRLEYRHVHQNRSFLKKADEKLSKESKDIIYRLFKKDFDSFQYSKDT